MPLNVSKRPGHLGELLNIRPKMIREDRFARFGIPVVGVELNREEYGSQLLLNPNAVKHFWKKFKGRDPELAYPMLGTQTLSRVIRDCTVNLWLQDRIMTLTSVTLAKSRVSLLSNSVVWGFTMQAMPQLNDLVESLLATLGQPVLIEIACPTWGAQPDLPLEEDDDDGEGEGDDDKQPDLLPDTKVSSIQKQIEGAEAKKKARARKKKAAKS